jgi:hypothetical protein
MVRLSSHLEGKNIEVHDYEINLHNVIIKNFAVILYDNLPEYTALSSLLSFT